MLWSTMGQTQYALEHCGLHWSHSVTVLYSMAVGAWLICSSRVRQIADDGPTQSQQKSGFADGTCIFAGTCEYLRILVY